MSDPMKSADVIRKTGINPKFGIVLGSGLGTYADQLEKAQIIPYSDLPGFPKAGVHGHAGQMVIGYAKGVPIAVMQGRTHYYEKGDAGAMKTPIRTFKELGCEGVVLTNAAGSIDMAGKPGSVMMITDHINYAGVSPLFNETDNSRFVDLVDAYDPEYRQNLLQAAENIGLNLLQGTYMWFCGPHFETPAEIKMAGIMGASAVGMSTVPEVILARQAGLKVAAISIITNFAAGLSNDPLSHEETMKNSVGAAADATSLLNKFLENM